MPRVKKIPQRMCVACRQMRPKREMVRIVRTPTGEVRVDSTGKAAGRGAYVDLSEECVRIALRERRLQHALESEIPDGIGGELEELRARPRTPPAPKVIRISAGTKSAPGLRGR